MPGTSTRQASRQPFCGSVHLARRAREPSVAIVCYFQHEMKRCLNKIQRHDDRYSQCHNLLTQVVLIVKIDCRLAPRQGTPSSPIAQSSPLQDPLIFPCPLSRARDAFVLVKVQPHEALRVKLYALKMQNVFMR